MPTSIRSRVPRWRGVALGALFASSLGLAACGRDEAASSSAEAAPGAAAPAGPPAAPTATDPNDTRELIAAAQDYAKLGCEAAKKRLDACRPCETSSQRPLRDLLYAYCTERETPSVARNLYEAIVLAYPGTETAATALMRLRQLETTEPASAASTVADGAKKAVPRNRPPPAYPRLADAAGIEGIVRVRFDVGADGRTSGVRVVESQPPLLFDAAALYAVERWSFEPVAASGQEIVLRFNLPKPESAAAAGPPAAPVESGE